MSRPEPAVLFALYHLGVDTTGNVKFRNLHDCARLLQVAPGELQTWLKAARIDQETATRTDFNISRAHVDAQLAGGPAEALSVAAEAYVAFVKARDEGGTTDVKLDIDYDDL
ncbi:MAG: hypothetical protein KC502_23190 [Myxococcales bacterium]|nr:hypothetical protein [Myxococcales bacterium]